MNIEGIHIEVTYDKKGNQIISIGDKQVFVDPNTTSQAWVLYESGRYDLIKKTKGWPRTIYNYIITNKDQPNIVLISLLLSI